MLNFLMSTITKFTFIGTIPKTFYLTKTFDRIVIAELLIV